ncbi:SIR2 family NAD-dependent protein deacylase [Adlercreutzia agrestimuris]|uniref:SIR2 family NAD-dependent protein deacylase n=1 Tax=Adlercreutzia agrestimuris TaxID=2941324 RepID=UPI00203B1A1E|nr:Sir2 silent information regulator family NAD-dependent deacetylase [Adlercreutzia agrestimuris]
MFKFADTRRMTPEKRAAAIDEARRLMQDADRVLIGAGAGLSTAAGIDYGGERFRDNFPAFIKRYGMTDMYSAGFYPFTTEEDRWAYWAHHATVNCLGADATSLYRELYEWARTRDYFVITTNADMQFEKAGFAKDRIFATQGDYAHIQCVTGEHGIRSDAEEFAAIERDTGSGARTRITDAGLVPTCDVCGRPMSMHLRIDGSFVQTEDWYTAEERYRDFISHIPEKPTLLLELGVGWNTPVWIRMPFERIAKVTDSPLIRMNYDSAGIDGSIKNSVSVDGDMAEALPLAIGEKQTEGEASHD